MSTSAGFLKGGFEFRVVFAGYLAVIAHNYFHQNSYDLF